MHTTSPGREMRQTVIHSFGRSTGALPRHSKRDRSMKKKPDRPRMTGHAVRVAGSGTLDREIARRHRARIGTVCQDRHRLFPRNIHPPRRRAGWCARHHPRRSRGQRQRGAAAAPTPGSARSPGRRPQRRPAACVTMRVWPRIVLRFQHDLRALVFLFRNMPYPLWRLVDRHGALQRGAASQAFGVPTAPLAVDSPPWASPDVAPAGVLSQVHDVKRRTAP